MKTQQLRIDGEIGSFWEDNGAKQIAQGIQLAQLESGDTLEIVINSVGGAVFEALGIIGAIKKARADGISVVAKVEGLAASAASLVACACSEVVMAVGSMMMIHNVQGYSYGDMNQLREDADLMEKIGSSLAGIYVAKTGKTKEDILSMMNEDKWMDGEEAVSLGFADRVDESFAMVACASLSMSGYAVPDRFKNVVAEPEKPAEPVIVAVVPVDTAPINTENIRRDAIIEERARIASIKNMAPIGVDVSELITNGTSVLEAPALILNMVNAMKPTEAEIQLQEFRNGISAPTAFTSENVTNSQIFEQYNRITDSKKRAEFFAQNREVIISFKK